VKPLDHYRDLVARGVTDLSLVPVLVVAVRGMPTPSKEFRTSTRASSAPPPPLVTVMSDPRTTVFELEKSTRNPYNGFLFVGRASTSDIILKDSSISKSHATLERVDNRDGREHGDWFVKDNRSRNGTHLNGNRLSDGERSKLAGGDLVVFGSYPAYFLEPTDLLRMILVAARTSSNRPNG
jgi:pSer/pThr/pTyr-binding forkhead associated (FHA) protein